jgi:hypothetical protein
MLILAKWELVSIMKKQLILLASAFLLIGIMLGFGIAQVIISISNIDKSTMDNMKALGIKNITIGDAYSNGYQLSFNVTIAKVTDNKQEIKRFVVNRYLDGKIMDAKARDEIVNDEINRRYAINATFNKILDGGVIQVQP